MAEVEERWASINPDLLGEIVKRLHSYSDYIRLHWVCKEWKSALPKLPDPKKRWLVIPGPEDAFESEIRMLREENIYPIMLPEMKDNLIRGSSHGWLVCVMMSDGAVRLLNPFTKAHIDLPPISAFPQVIAYNPDDAEVDPYTILDPRSDTIYPASPRIVHYVGIWKLVLSSPPDNDTHDFMAAAIYGVCCRLGFYRHSDGRWRDVPIPMAEPDFQDVIIVQDKIYAVDWTAQLYVFDAKTEPVPLGGICEAVPPPAFPDMKSCYVGWNKYLISFADDSLLMLIRYLERDGCGDDTSGFLIFRLDKDAEQWLQIHTLGCCTLMVGNNTSEYILARPSPDSKSNRIYYTDNLSRYIDGHRRDIGIFNLEDKSFKRLVFDEKFFCSPHFQRHIVRGIEGIIAVSSKQMEIVRKLAMECCKYGTENEGSSYPLAGASLQFGNSYETLDNEKETLLRIVGDQISEPLRAQITGAPVEDACHLTHRYNKLHQEGWKPRFN